MNDGYIALLISIFRRVPPEESFMILEGRKKRMKWTSQKVEDIQRMRERGDCWPDIAMKYGIPSKSLRRTYYRYKAI